MRTYTLDGDVQTVWWSDSDVPSTLIPGGGAGTYTYVARQLAVDSIATPPGWPPNWMFPPDVEGPWPPGWPMEESYLFDDVHTLEITLPASITAGTAIAVVARVLDSVPDDTDDLDEHFIRVTAAIGDTVVRVKENAADAWVEQFFAVINNYTGAKYGISKSLLFDVAGQEGETLTLTFEVWGVGVITGGDFVADIDATDTISIV